MKAEDIWKIWDEVIGVDVGVDPVPFAQAVLNAAPTGDIEHVAQVLACEIECSIFEQHVAPALEVALKALSPTQGADARPVAIKRVRFPDLSEELYEHYVQMSAQTHAAEVKKYAKSVLATRDAAPSEGPEFRESATKLVDDMLTAWTADLPISACGEISARANALLQGRDASAPMEKT